MTFTEDRERRIADRLIEHAARLMRDGWTNLVIVLPPHVLTGMTRLDGYPIFRMPGIATSFVGVIP